MRPAERAGEPLGGFRANDEMNVIGHQAIGPQAHSRAPKVLREQIAIEFLTTLLEEDRLSAIAPRGDMVRNAGYDDAGEPSHDAT